MARHTEGPWKVGSLDPVGQRVVTAEYYEIATCWHHSVCEIEQQMEANAALIAAAPDLLAALKAVVTVADRRTDEFEDARAAIAKAEGDAP